jgi:glycosyltransferase involved in cell wall biosynthesis
VGLIQARKYASTDRYCDALIEGFEHREIDILSYAPKPRAGGASSSLRRAEDYARRWIWQPIDVRRLHVDLFHLVDFIGPLPRVTPPERTLVTCQDLILLLAAEGSVSYDGPHRYIRQFRWGAQAMSRAAGVICPSEATRRDVLRMCDIDPARVHVIPLGVDSRFTPMPARADLRRQLGTSAAHIVLNVGTEVFYKNIRATLETIHVLRQSGCDAVLVRVGGSLAPAEQAERSRLGLDSSVIELGRISDERLVELYNFADVLLFPSLAEGFGLPVLEAMACGTPVVAADIPALREVGGDAVTYAPADDPYALAAAVRSSLGPPEHRADVIERGLARAAEFGWSRTMNAYEELYGDVAGRAGPRRGSEMRPGT